MTDTAEAPEAAWTELWPEGAASQEWSHSGIAITSDGRVVFGDPSGDALILLREETGEFERVPIPTLAVHGIADATLDGEEFLWIADPGVKNLPESNYDPLWRPGQVLRVSLSTGATTLITQPDIARYRQSTWRPTSVAVVSDDASHLGDLWVADGYGESLVHRFSDDGVTLTFDGSESGRTLDCPHGIVIDHRGPSPELVIADRSNRRLVFYSLTGDFLKVLESELFASPSSIAVRGDELIVTELDGALLGVAMDGTVRSIVALDPRPKQDGWPNRATGEGFTRPSLEEGRLNSPHGVAVAANGDVYLTEWVIGGRQIRLSL